MPCLWGDFFLKAQLPVAFFHEFRYATCEGSWSWSSSGTRKIHHVSRFFLDLRCISQNHQTKRSRSKNKQNKVFVIDESGFILVWPPWTPKDSITKLGRWVKLEFTKQQKLGMEKWIYSKKRWEHGNSFSSKQTLTQQHTEHERAVNKHPHVERTNRKKQLLIKFVKQNNPRKKMMQGNNWAYLVSVARFWPKKSSNQKRAAQNSLMTTTPTKNGTKTYFTYPVSVKAVLLLEKKPWHGFESPFNQKTSLTKAWLCDDDSPGRSCFNNCSKSSASMAVCKKWRFSGRGPRPWGFQWGVSKKRRLDKVTSDM